jgi:membrane protein DedA with SNARE-associated domain
MVPLATIFEVHTLIRWLRKGKYGALFGLLFSCGLGLPMPEDVPLLATGILVYHGEMNIWLAAPLAWLGILGGDCVLYTIGYFAGEKITKIPFIGSHVTRTRLERAEILFRKYGVWMVALGRLFMGIRGAMIVAAGTSRLKFHKFIIADGLAAIVSGGLFVYLGYWGGEYGPGMAEKVTHFKYGLWIAAGVLAVILIFIFFWRGRDDEEAAPE